MLKLLVPLVAAISLASSAASSATVTIDFDDLSGEAPSFTQYGVVFTSTDGDPLRIQVGPGGLPSPKALIPVQMVPAPYPAMRADIAALTSFVSVDLGDFGGDPDEVFLEAYDAASVLLGRVSHQNGALNGYWNLSLSFSGIHHVIFGGVAQGGSSVLADNFTFQSDIVVPPDPPSPIPEPSTWAMLIVGFGLVGSAVRRRRLDLA